MILNETTCPVCNSTKASPYFTHRRWKTTCLKCPDCTHVFCGRYFREKEDIFRTNIGRADHYLRILSEVEFLSILDVGTPSDFYFLRGVLGTKKGLSAYSYDVYEKEPPDGVRIVGSIGAQKVDVITAFHVLEHVEEPQSFVKEISRSCRHFLIEVPGCETREFAEISSTQPHFHFFNLKSITRLFHDVTCDIGVRTGEEIPAGRSMIVVSRIPRNTGLRVDKKEQR